MKEAGVFEVIELQGWEKKSTSKELETFKGRLLDPISKDYFLFTCAEEKRTLAAVLQTNAGSYTLKRCFPFDQAFLHHIENQTMRLGRLFEEVLLWHKSHKPVLSLCAPLTYATHVDFGPEFVLLCHDLNTLCRMIEKSYRGKPETKDSGPWDIQALMGRFIAPQLREVFKEKGEWMESFLSWEFGGGKGASAEAWETDRLRSIPPEGRYLFMHQRVARKHAFLARDGGSKRNAATHSGEVSLEPAEREVRQALATMKKDAAVSVQILAPQNSFVRRAQHNMIAKAEGFASQSVESDEGKAVKIYRQKVSSGK